MEYPSTLLNAYYDCFYPDKSQHITPDELAGEIAETVNTASRAVYDRVISTPNPAITKLIKDKYLPFTKDTEINDSQLYQMLICNCPEESVDNFKKLKETLIHFTCQTNCHEYEINGVKLYENITYPKKNWYTTRLYQIINMPDTDDRETIQAYILFMIHMALSEKLFDVEENNNYFRPAMDAFKKYIPHMWNHCVDLFFTDSKLYRMLICDCPEESVDNYRKLKEKLTHFTCQTKCQKYEIDGVRLYENIDYPEKNWYVIRLYQIINMPDTDDRETIQAYILFMIHMALSEKLFDVEENNNYFRPAMDAFKKYIPHMWNHCVDLYFVIKGKKLITIPTLTPGQESDYISNKLLISYKNAYSKVMHLALINHISSYFMDQEDLYEFDENTFNKLWNYFGKPKKFKPEIKKFVYYENNNNKNPLPRNCEPDTPLTKNLYYFGIVSLIAYLRLQYHNPDMAENVKTFLKAMDTGLDSSKFNTDLAPESITNIVGLTASSRETGQILNAYETKLAQSISKCFKVQQATQHLKLFTETWNQIVNPEKEDAIFNSLSEIFEIKKKLSGNSSAKSPTFKKDMLNELAPKLEALVLAHDKLKVDFTAFDILRDPGLDLKKEDFTLHLLRAYEIEYINFLKNDLYYTKDVREKNYQAIRDSFRFRSKNILNSSVFDIYKSVAYRVEVSYKSYKKRDECTERDLLAELNDYAYSRFMKELGAETKPIKLNHSTALVSSNILNEKLEFVSKDEQIACAAMGFTEGEEGANCDSGEFTNKLLRIAEVYCKDNGENHLTSISKDFLTFGIVSVLALPPLKKKDVINCLCMEANKIALAKDRMKQETIVVLLNLVVIQPKARLESTTAKEILNTIFKRVLYPDQILTISRIEQQPLLKKVLADRKKMLEKPRLKKAQFPSPFFMYLYSSEYAASAKEDEKFKDYLEYNNNQISPISEVKFNKLCVTDFYKISLLVQGISWQLYTTDQSADTKIKIHQSLFSTLINRCYEIWQKTDTSKASDDLLKLTWGSQLLLTAFSNCIREEHFDNSDWDHKKLMEIAMHADYTQRRFNGGYAKLLEGSAKVPYFWLISGGHRYLSILQNEKKEVQKVKFFESHPEASEFYKSVLLMEKKTGAPAKDADAAVGNYRFYILVARLLSYTDFYDICKENLFSLEDLGITLENYTNTFLEYDNILPFLETFLKKQ